MARLHRLLQSRLRRLIQLLTVTVVQPPRCLLALSSKIIVFIFFIVRQPLLQVRQLPHRLLPCQLPGLHRPLDLQLPLPERAPPLRILSLVLLFVLKKLPLQLRQFLFRLLAGDHTLLERLLDFRLLLAEPNRPLVHFLLFATTVPDLPLAPPWLDRLSGRHQQMPEIGLRWRKNCS